MSKKTITIIILISCIYLDLGTAQAQTERQTSTITTNTTNNHDYSFKDPFYWNPFREFELYSKRMREMMEPLKNNSIDQSTFYNPELSLEQKENFYIIEIDLPGLEKESINIEIDNNFLTISGEREMIDESQSENGFYRSERSYGSFKRTLTLPKDAKNDNIEANYENGVLKIEIPREETNENSKKTIQIN